MKICELKPVLCYGTVLSSKQPALRVKISNLLIFPVKILRLNRFFVKVLFSHQNSLRHVLKQIVVYGASSVESITDDLGIYTNHKIFIIK